MWCCWSKAGELCCILQRLCMDGVLRVAVCGGGVVGTSVAYHLAERGVKDVVLLEQGR